MTCSPGRLAADRLDSRKSTGPETPEGTAIARRDGLKPGLAGRGVALPDEDAAEVARRFGAFEAELAPRTELGRTLALRVAMLAVRLERCYRNEAARLGLAVDSARKRHEDERLAAVEHLLDTIHDDPATNARRLQRTPEGVALTIAAWRALGEDLARGAWDVAHRERAENLMGRRLTELPRSRIGALSDALSGRFDAPEPGEAEGLDDRGRRDHARRGLTELVEGRIATLTAFRAAMDLEAHHRAALGAPDRALFDASAEAVLARKHEAATERSLFRTLREFREVEASLADGAPSIVASGTSESEAACGGLGSSLPGSLRHSPGHSTGPVAARSVAVGRPDLPARPRGRGDRRPTRAAT